MFFEKRDDTASLLLKKMVNFKPELNLESITPKNYDFTHPRVSPFVALEISQETVHDSYYMHAKPGSRLPWAIDNFSIEIIYSKLI